MIIIFLMLFFSLEDSCIYYDFVKVYYEKNNVNSSNYLQSTYKLKFPKSARFLDEKSKKS